MNKILVFYAGMLYGEYDQLNSYIDLPDGVYTRLPDGRWRHKRDNVVMPIDTEDVPKELLLLTLLLT